ncbi:hypothetical protein [Kitasatospora sp. NPDC004272]
MTDDPQDFAAASMPVPTAAAYQLADAIRLFARSLRRHNPTTDGPVDHGEIAATLHLAFDSMHAALESAAIHAGGPLDLPPVSAWNRAMHDALNLRDHLGYAIPDGFDWDRIERWPGQPGGAYDVVAQRLNRLRALRRTGSSPATGRE